MALYFAYLPDRVAESDALWRVDLATRVVDGLHCLHGSLSPARTLEADPNLEERFTW